VLGDDPQRHVGELAVAVAAELRRRGGADRIAVEIGQQVEMVGLLPVVDDHFPWDRRLRMDPRADGDVRVEVGLADDWAYLDHGSGPCIVSTRERFS